MTFTSFNPIQYTQVDNSTKSQPFTVKKGQVYHATIKKLFPDQMAEVQIGNQKMFAKLDVPLKAGDSYFLQVKSAAPQIEFSLVSNSTTNLSPQEQLGQLMESMNLPKNAEVTQLVKSLIKNEVPIIKEQILEAANLMKNIPQGVEKQEVLIALQKMIGDKMPLQQNVLNALIFGSKTSGMIEDLQTFSQAIMQENNLSLNVKESLTNTLQKIATPFEGEVGGEILKNAINTLQNQNANSSLRIAMLNLLKESGVLPKKATLQNWQTMCFQQIANEEANSAQQAGQIVQMLKTANATNMQEVLTNVKQCIQQQPLFESQKNELIQNLNQLQIADKSSKSIEQFAKNFHQKLIEAFTNNEENLSFNLDKNGISPKEHLLSLLKPINNQDAHSQLLKIANMSKEANQQIIQNMSVEAEKMVQSNLDGKAMQFALKNVLNSLGLSYEAAIKNSDLDKVIDSLKPQLLSLLTNHDVSESVKDSASNLLSRLNGMQIASGEQNHQHQLIMQIPLQFFGKQVDATVQWNGRMKKDGKIDADYARVLFYLDMQTLKETMIDMQVQNRIVTIQFFNNNTDLEQLAEPLKESLKVGLKNHDYHLSGIFFKQFQKDVQIEKKKVDTVEHSGVDIRI